MLEGRKYLQFILLKAKILESDGTTFEDLFCQIMQIAENPDFKKVKPHGKVGDRKNDGFNQKTGSYYQVYAPENIESKVLEAAKKARTDFNGLKAHWQTICPIQAFYFVFNDKFKGSYPEIYEEISNLKKENADIGVIDQFTCENLVAKFNELDDDDKMRIVGHCPNPEDVTDVSYVALQEVIRFLKNMDGSNKEGELVVPDFEEKIKFNNLSDTTGELLRQGGFQVYALEKFFDDEPQLRSELQKKFKALYDHLMHAWKDMKNGKEDFVFMNIIASASPLTTKEARDAVVVLMAYYFESCDIYEEPQSNSQ